MKIWWKCCTPPTRRKTNKYLIAMFSKKNLCLMKVHKKTMNLKKKKLEPVFCMINWRRSKHSITNGQNFMVYSTNVAAAATASAVLNAVLPLVIDFSWMEGTNCSLKSTCFTLSSSCELLGLPLRFSCNRISSISSAGSIATLLKLTILMMIKR